MTSREKPFPTKTGLFADRPWYHPLALARRGICYYMLVCVALFFLQGSLLFPRWITGSVYSQKAALAEIKSSGLMPWKSPGPGAPPYQGCVTPDFNKPAARGTIVVFHGNAGGAFNRVYFPEAFSRRGFRTFLYEYPGYGGRTGSPSASSIIGDAQSLIRSLDRAGYGPVYVWGESVGTGVAAAACSDPTLPVHGLVMLTPWDTLAHAATVHYPFFPVSLLLWDKYDSIANLEHFQHPVCVVYSNRDKLLPPPLALNLFDHLPMPKKLIMHPDCGHNDWPSSPELTWWDDALNFISSASQVLRHE